MSVQTLYTAATGMEALQTKLDVVANNLANVNTTAFKRGHANFEDLFYRHHAFPGALDAQNTPTATGTSIGLGSRVSSVQTDFTQGAFRQTNDPLNILIEGKGFLQVLDPSTNQTLYTRAGNLSVNANGQLVVGSASTGRMIQPPVTIAGTDITNISINDSGQVLVKQVGQPQPQQVGQLQLALFVNPEGLLKLGENLYSTTTASGDAQFANPGLNGAGSIRSGMLEASNVEPVQELIDLITTQRSFELNSQAIKAGDEILQLISNLRRG